MSFGGCAVRWCRIIVSVASPRASCFCSGIGSHLVANTVIVQCHRLAEEQHDHNPASPAAPPFRITRPDAGDPLAGHRPTRLDRQQFAATAASCSRRHGSCLDANRRARVDRVRAVAASEPLRPHRFHTAWRLSPSARPISTQLAPTAAAIRTSSSRSRASSSNLAAFHRSDRISPAFPRRPPVSPGSRHVHVG